MGQADNKRRKRGSERLNLETWAGQTFEALLNQRNPPARLDCAGVR